jgi:DNA recombination protein RmuC
MSAIWLIIGAAAAGITIWLLTRSRLAEAVREKEELARERDEARRAIAQREQQLADVRGQLAAQVARLEAERTGAAEKVHLLEKTKADLNELVKASCVDAFKEGNAQIVELAEARLKADRAEGKREIERMVKPVADNLQQFKVRLEEIERAHVAGQTELREQLTTLGRAQQELMAGTSALVGALQRPQIRGRWGEMTLKRVVEVAGMQKHVDFTEQPSLEGEDGRLRPDLIVHIPGEKDVVVDSKAPLEAYLEASSATDEVERRRLLETHARQLREHIKKLGSKRYWEECSTVTPDFVFCFVPNDQVLAAAAEADPDLLGLIERQRVFLATPMTLMVLLRVVAVAWQQEKMTESARDVWKAGRDLYRRLAKLGERIMTLRKRLSSTLTAFNELVGSYQGRVLPAARRFGELGPMASPDNLPVPEQILEAPRALDAPEVSEVGEVVRGADDVAVREPEEDRESTDEPDAGEAA